MRESRVTGGNFSSELTRVKSQRAVCVSITEIRFGQVPGCVLAQRLFVCCMQPGARRRRAGCIHTRLATPPPEATGCTFLVKRGALHCSAGVVAANQPTNAHTHINNSQPGGRQRCGGSFSGKRLLDAGASEREKTFDVNPGDTFLRTTISGSRRQKEKKAEHFALPLVLRVGARWEKLVASSEPSEIISNSLKVYSSCLLHRSALSQDKTYLVWNN